MNHTITIEGPYDDQGQMQYVVALECLLALYCKYGLARLKTMPLVHRIFLVLF